MHYPRQRTIPPTFLLKHATHKQTTRICPRNRRRSCSYKKHANVLAFLVQWLEFSTSSGVSSDYGTVTRSIRVEGKQAAEEHESANQPTFSLPSRANVGAADACYADYSVDNRVHAVCSWLWWHRIRNDTGKDGPNLDVPRVGRNVSQYELEADMCGFGSFTGVCELFRVCESSIALHSVFPATSDKRRTMMARDNSGNGDAGHRHFQARGAQVPLTPTPSPRDGTNIAILALAHPPSPFLVYDGHPQERGEQPTADARVSAGRAHSSRVGW